jgi:hypothetical protein
MYLPNLLDLIIPLIFVFIICIVLAIFSPLGIGFIIFSILRIKTENLGLRKASFIFQIILSSLTFFIGLLICLLFLFSGSSFYYNSGWIFTLAILFGVGFVVILEVGIIIWESFELNKKEQVIVKKR